MSTPPEAPLEITLTLPVGEVEVILAGLGELPHKRSHQTISKVVAQAREQMASPEAPPTKPKK